MVVSLPVTTVAEYASCVRQHWETSGLDGSQRILCCFVQCDLCTALPLDGEGVWCQSFARSPTLMWWPVALELLNSLVQLLPSLGCELQEPGCVMIWCGGAWGKYVTARVLLREIFLVVSPDTLVSWSLNCHQNLEKWVPVRKDSGVTLGEWQILFMLRASECTK